MMRIIPRPAASEPRSALDSTQETVSREHAHLSELLSELASACQTSPAGESPRGLFEELRDALEAHFVREESLYYPTVWALRPELEQPLRTLIRGHAVFREQIEAIDAALSPRSLSQARRLLVAFGGLFEQHERSEEACLRDLVEGARPGA